jgi:hypothetical protein
MTRLHASPSVRPAFLGVFVACAAVLFPGCGEPPGPGRRDASVSSRRAVERHAKPPMGRPAGGAVEVRADVRGDSSATVRLRWLMDAEDVSVRVYGTDGLRVLSEPLPVVERALAAGDEQDLDVRFDPGPSAHANLAVLIEATFAGRRRTIVRTVTIGAARPADAPVPDAPLPDMAEVDGRPVPLHRRPAREKK